MINYYRGIPLDDDTEKREDVEKDKAAEEWENKYDVCKFARSEQCQVQLHPLWAKNQTGLKVAVHRLNLLLSDLVYLGPH